MSISGGCFCGAVTYQVDASEFRWLTGEDLLSTYLSGPDYGHQFCSQCGSTLCGVFSGKVHGVTLGCIDGDPGIEIGYHVFVDSKASWEVIPDGVTVFGKRQETD